MKHLHSVCFLVLSYTCFLLCAVTPVRADTRREAEALVNWKASLDGADESLGPWSMANSTSLCRWTHITCEPAGQGHITKLDISYTSLNGTLDKLDFSAFPHLRSLTLIQNGLIGTIPAGIGNLTSLVMLRIMRNPYLRGGIPRSIGQLNQLSILQLEALGLDSTLPEEIGNLTSLMELNIHLVNLAGSIPPTIGMLMQLRELSLVGNNLTGSIPMEIGNMTGLQTIDLHENYLGGQLPDTISHLVKLQYLHLSENQLVGHIFPELGNSSLMTVVTIANNNFSGHFPSSICAAGALSTISAEYNGFTGIHHHTFQNCTTLEYVDFTANNIVAELRHCFTERLAVMSFSQNQLYGTFLTGRGESFLCNHTDLNFLDLSSNALHGGLTKCFWDMQNLQFIDLSSNSFSCVVPFSRTYQDNLRYLLLANNQFTGTFPLGLKKCKNLFALDLGGNNFSGGIPSWVSMSLPELNFLRLSSNMFDGIIPHEILQFQQLRLLDLSKNKLTGPIPDDFTNLIGMTQDEDIDYPHQYQYRLRIQITWKNVDYVYHPLIAFVAGIDLSGNSLSQEIPKGLTTLIGLRYLNLSGNHLSGCIPEDIGNMVLIEALDLSRNQLSGKIPQSLAALKSISVLNFSSNSLSGRIPTGDQLRTLDDPSIYSNNLGLCGFLLEDCVSSSTPPQTETSLDEDRETLWLYCFVAAGFILGNLGFWLYWGIFMFRSETRRYAFYQYVDNMQAKVTKKVYSCISRFQAGGSE